MTDLPEMTPVASSNIHSVGHNGAALYVRFLRDGEPGALYRYSTAGAEHKTGMLTADSAGRYHARVVKAQHVGELVTEDSDDGV